MSDSGPVPQAQRGVTFTVRPRPGLTKEERLARRVRALERLLALPIDVPPEDGPGDKPKRRTP